MLARNHLSAIIVTSSGLGLLPFPGIITYSCSKSFVDYLMIGLNYELKGKIDCMSWMCSGTSTKLSKKPVGGIHLSPEDAVIGMMKDLGKESRTFG